MSASGRILAVDDTPANLKLLTGMLGAQGYTVITASNGEQALASVSAEQPDLVLLDIMMPGMSGYDVCRTIRANPATALLPIVMCTALDPNQERVKGIEAGADDFLQKPVNQSELIARVKSLLRVKSLQDKVRQQAEKLADWNAMLEARVREQVGQIERLGRLKNFFSPQVGDAIVAGGEDIMNMRRREVTVVFLDLRRFTSFIERAEPEEVMALLREYHAAMGARILAHNGTLERFAGDGIMVFFNDPLPVDAPGHHAVGMALEMQADFAPVAAAWRKRGHDLALGIGIAQGYATCGAIGFEGRWDYAAIGNVTNLASRLCSHAGDGEVLIDRRTMAGVEDAFGCTPIESLELKGIAKPVDAFRVTGVREGV